MADFSKLPPSKNFVDRTGKTPYNDFHKFMIHTLMEIGLIERMKTHAEIQAEDEEYTRQQREEYYRNQGKVKDAPIFPELDAVVGKIRGKK